jgi:pantoate--beta-alanine ligase
MVGSVIVTTTRAELHTAREKLDGTVAVVMTMGALHDGHRELLRAARTRAEHVVVTIFVNPLQFGPNEDFDRYPRSLDADLAMCREAGVDVVFAPDRAQMYPNGEPAVRVDPGPLGATLEGEHRPGFFHGVLTVVLKLLHLTRPDLAFFGEKDYQQLVLVRQLAADTDLPVRVLGVPTVREADGLARSSRNRYLSPEGRRLALSLSAALSAGQRAARDGGDAGAALAAGRAAFAEATTDTAARAVSGDSVPAVTLDYLVVTDPALGPAPASGPARMLVAARVGDTRLIDNAPLSLSGES